MTPAAASPAGDRWHLMIDAGTDSQRSVASAPTLQALQNHADTTFWIRNRRGRQLEALDTRTGAVVRYVAGRGWFRA